MTLDMKVFLRLYIGLNALSILNFANVQFLVMD